MRLLLIFQEEMLARNMCYVSEQIESAKNGVKKFQERSIF